MKNTVVSMNGFHAFLDKQKAFHEIWRVLKPGGDFIACFYIRGKGGFLYRFRRRKS
ncbi:Methyltransferase domain protein [Blautia luti]|uniref:Methyltransferase domain protein n=2 Tax=Lachnospiraceae TaxID=186803 RepID=A0A564W578_9FIRM|nr:Methyltransferase domain protein [Blautia luti]